jgi:hypothetical protein
MVDPISVGAIVISSLTALGGVIAGIHIKRMNSGCCECECFETVENKLQRRKTISPPGSPRPIECIKTEPIKSSSIV